MKKILYIVALYIFTLFVMSAHAGFLTANLWQKGKKKVLVLGDRCHDVSIKSQEKLWPEDQKQWFVFRTALGRINSKNDQKTTLLTDVTTDFREYTIPLLEQMKPTGNRYIGMHMQLNTLVAQGHYGGIKTVEYDVRNRVLEDPIEFIDTISRVPAHLHKLRQFHEILLKKLPKVTIHEYSAALDKFSRTLDSEPLCLTQAKDFFSDALAKDPTTFVKDVLLKNFITSTSFKHFMKQNQWIMDLHDVMGTVGIKQGLDNAIPDTNPFILYAGQNHAITANKELEKAGYRCIHAEGEQTCATKEKEHYLSPELLEVLLEKFISNETYCICTKSTTQRCGRCKAAYYCSQACQRKDWPQHKAHCETK